MGAFFSKARNTFDPATDLVDLNGKVVIVTGGNRGIGYATVKSFARAGAKVYLAARSEQAALEAIQRLRSEGLEPGNGEVLFLKLDQSDPREAKASAVEFLKRESRLDILVHNAAHIRGSYELTSDGVSTFVIVNYFSPVIFTRALLPLMTKTSSLPDADVRIVHVSSGAMNAFPTQGLNFNSAEDLNMEFKGTVMDTIWRYGHSKLLGAMWINSLQKQFDMASPSMPITAISLHPGIVKTDIKQNHLAWKLVAHVFGVGPERGTYNILFASASKQIAQRREEYKGKYIEPIGIVVPPSAPALSNENSEALWRTTEEFLKKIGVF